MKCECCGHSTQGYELLDYCAVCSKNLCEKCMDEGCCKNKPALSGEADDFGEKDEPIERKP